MHVSTYPLAEDVRDAVLTSNVDHSPVSVDDHGSVVDDHPIWGVVQQRAVATGPVGGLAPKRSAAIIRSRVISVNPNVLERVKCRWASASVAGGCGFPLGGVCVGAGTALVAFAAASSVFSSVFAFLII